MATPGPGTRIISGIPITPCEFDIIREAMQGKARKEMAVRLEKTLSTIDSQLRILFKKLRVLKITEVVAWATENGFKRDGSFESKEKVVKKRGTGRKKK